MINHKQSHRATFVLNIYGFFSPGYLPNEDWKNPKKIAKCQVFDNLLSELDFCRMNKDETFVLIGKLVTKGLTINTCNSSNLSNSSIGIEEINSCISTIIKHLKYSRLKRQNENVGQNSKSNFGLIKLKNLLGDPYVKILTFPLIS